MSSGRTITSLQGWGGGRPREDFFPGIPYIFEREIFFMLVLVLVFIAIGIAMFIIGTRKDFLIVPALMISFYFPFRYGYMIKNIYSFFIESHNNVMLLTIGTFLMVYILMYIGYLILDKHHQKRL